MTGLAFPKFRDLPLKAERQQKRKTRVSGEERNKRKARQRDRRTCRVPHCTKQREGYALNVAHLEDKKMGGDKRLLRSQLENLACLCWWHHRGPMGLHSKHLTYAFQDPSLGANGLMNWFLCGRFIGAT